MTQKEALDALELSCLPDTEEELKKHFRKKQKEWKLQANEGASHIDLPRLREARDRLAQEMERRSDGGDRSAAPSSSDHASGVLARFEVDRAVSQMDADLRGRVPVTTDPPKVDRRERGKTPPKKRRKNSGILWLGFGVGIGWVLSKRT